jgi:predicted O-linked N-acetylglucosamine transferase (SPINDLY family)
VQNQKLSRLIADAAAQLQAGRLDAAARLCAQARALGAREFAPWHLSGIAALQQGRAAEAADWLARARRLQPRSASTIMCLGLAWNALGRRADAEAALRESIRLTPRSAECWINLGAVLITGGAVEETVACFRKAVELAPESAASWTGLGSALVLAGRIDEAIAAHTRALELDPRHPKAHFSRALAWLKRHRVAEALADFDAQLTRSPDHVEARSGRLFVLNFIDGMSREALAAEHRAFGRLLEAGRGSARVTFDRNAVVTTRRLRVGFVSPDLREHAVAHFIEPLLRCLDPDRFEVWLYYDHYAEDPTRRRLEDLAAGYRRIVGQSIDAVETLIRADAPDILVDLAGHTGLNRLPLFARRVAPVQLAYVGYPNTTGLSAMDYRLTDAIVDPVGETDPLHSEQLVRFAPTAWAYQPLADAPAVAPAPSAAGGAVTFGSFNSLSKVNDRTLRLWRDVLAAVPDSRLALKSLGLDPAFWRQRLAAQGIAGDRIVFLPEAKTIAEHLACYAQIDVALDPFPYQGTTTTCDALWMGRPVVTLLGDRHASRVGASLLTAVGHPEWIARSEADYVALAVDLAGDRERLATISGGLRDEMRRSSLLDHAGQAARFGEALRTCWAEWCAKAAREN